MSYEERIEAALKACGNDEFVVDSVLRAFWVIGDTLYVIEWDGSRSSDGAPLNIKGRERLHDFISNNVLVPLQPKGDT